jgi:hypothetical protein
MNSLKTTIRLLAATVAINALFGAGMNAHAQAANFKNTRAYQDAFTCGKESLQSDPSGNSAVSYCIGNSRDPSKIELQAFKDVAGQHGSAKKPANAQALGKPIDSARIIREL